MFIPRYFYFILFFETIVSEIVFLISFSTWSLLVYRFLVLVVLGVWNQSYTCARQVIYHLNQSTSWKSYWFLYANFVSCYFAESVSLQEGIILPLLCLNHFYSFFFALLFWVAIPVKYGIRVGRVRHSWLIPDFRGNYFSFSPVSMIFAMGLSYIAFTGVDAHFFYS
jgi:hypothetical protein